MLCNELVAIAEIGGQVSADAVGPSHQHVDEVVDDDRHLCTGDRLKPNRPIGHDAHSLSTLHSSHRSGNVRGHARTPAKTTACLTESVSFRLLLARPSRLALGTDGDALGHGPRP